MCAKVPKATNRQNNNSADESMTGKKLKTTMALDSTDFYHVKYLGRILKIIVDKPENCFGVKMIMTQIVNKTILVS